MPRTLNRLKPLSVERTKAPGRYADGGGLYLIVKPCLLYTSDAADE